jgi:hypothetical protein
MGRCGLCFLAIVLTATGGLFARGDDQGIREGTKTTDAPAALVESLKDKDAKARLKAKRARYLEISFVHFIWQ